MTLSKKLLSAFMIAFIIVAGLGATQETAFAACEVGQVANAATGSCTDLPGGDAASADGIKDTVEDNTALSSIVGTMYKFATIISGLIFGVSVIMIVWAGFKYATSQGETKVTEQAKMQIITAGIGIGVALFAMIIVKVFAEIYGVS